MPAADAEPGMGRGTTVPAPALPSNPPCERAVSVLWSFGKCLGALLPVYLAGYYGFSISVVLFGLMIYMGWKHSRLEKVMRLKSAMYLLENERKFTTENVFRTKRDLPPWVRSGPLLCSLLSPVTSATSVRLNSSCISATSLSYARYTQFHSSQSFVLSLQTSQNERNYAQKNGEIAPCKSSYYVHDSPFCSVFSCCPRPAPYLDIPPVQCLGN